MISIPSIHPYLSAPTEEHPVFAAVTLPEAPGSVFGGLTIITSTAVAPGRAMLFSEPSPEQKREMVGVSPLEQAAYLHKHGRAVMVRFEEEGGGDGR